MVMSLQWQQWKEQTRSFFEKLDASQLPVDTMGAVSLVPQVFIIGNDPYYKVMTGMARSRGWSVRKSFNTDYDTEIPLTKGHLLLIETHSGEPIVDPAVLDRFYPQASRGLKLPARAIEIDGTTIMFVDFAASLDALGDDGMPGGPQGR
jgi:hypothetical protein